MSHLSGRVVLFLKAIIFLIAAAHSSHAWASSNMPEVSLILPLYTGIPFLGVSKIMNGRYRS